MSVIDKIDWLMVKEIMKLGLAVSIVFILIMLSVSFIKEGGFSDEIKPHWEKEARKQRRKNAGKEMPDLRNYHPANRALLQDNPKWLEMLYK